MKNEDDFFQKMSFEELSSRYRTLLGISFSQWSPEQWKLATEYRKRTSAKSDIWRRWLTTRLGARYADVAEATNSDGRAILQKTASLTKFLTDEEAEMRAYLRGAEPTQDVFEFDECSTLVACLHETITTPMGFPMPFRISFLKLWLTPQETSHGARWPCVLFEWYSAPETAIQLFKERFPLNIALGKTFV